MHPTDPTIILLSQRSAQSFEYERLELACRFYGFKPAHVTIGPEGFFTSPTTECTDSAPILVVVDGVSLSKIPTARLTALKSIAESYRSPIAVVGINPDCDRTALSLVAAGVEVEATTTEPGGFLWISPSDPSSPGFELRGIPLGLGSESGCQLKISGEPSVQVMATVGLNEATSAPAMVRINHGGRICYLLAQVRGRNAVNTWQYRRSAFGEIAPYLLLLRDVGGAQCWQPSFAMANLTIDDPRLTEPYGCLSFTGLLEQMRREHFHATIGFVPWNFDRNDADVVTLFRDNPDHYSIAIHGNNHDRYEFFRYEHQPGDQQRAKSLHEQIFNIRQALARMAEFHRSTGLHFDPVMVFPHGVCPAATFSALKQCGFWATSNYSNVPLGETPPVDATSALRSVNTEWSGFPAMRRNYPHNYSKEAVAIDLFLGNPVLFMAHQDLFFEGIEAFNAHARMVNECQPAVRWTSLGEISRHLFLIRWLNSSHCDVRLMSRHAKIKNTQTFPVEFQFTKHEPDPSSLASITIDGFETPWGISADWIHFVKTVPPGATSLVELHYHPLAGQAPVDVRRRGVRNHILRTIAEFRDLTLARSRLGRLLTRRYYRPGQQRPTLSGLVSRLTKFK